MIFDYWKIINGDKESEPILAQLSCEAFTKHFRKINMSQESETNGNMQFRDADNSPLNVNITRDEMLKSIAKLNNNKACGIDLIINEFLKCSKDSMCDLYVNFFNLVLKTCIIPKDWVIGLIKPLYKNKGSKSDVDNYRPITLLKGNRKEWSDMGFFLESVDLYRVSTFALQVRPQAEA